MKVDKKVLRDLLLPGIATIEGRTAALGQQIDIDLLETRHGLALVLTTPRDVMPRREKTVHLFSSDELESGAFKDSFADRTIAAVKDFMKG